MSIRLKLTLIFIAIAAIPLFFVSALTFTNYKNSLEDSRLSQLQDIIAFKADKIETYFLALKNNIEVAQGFYSIKNNFPVLTRLSADQLNPDFIAAKKILDEQLRWMQSVLGLSDIMLISPGGKVVYTTNPRHYSVDFSRPLLEVEQKAFDEGGKKVYFSDVFLSKALGNKLAILVTAPAFDSVDNFIGVIAFEVEMAPFYKLIQESIGLGKTGETLLGKKIVNEIVYLNPLRHDPDAALKRRIRLGDKFGGPIQEAAQGRRGSGELIDYRGKLVIASWRYIPLLDWGVVGKIDTEEAYGAAVNLRNLIIFILSIVFVLAGIMAFSISGSISKPIKMLSKGAAIIGSGDLDYKVALNSEDEIGQLSRAFDKMTQDLKKITASRDDLDEEIIERKRAEQDLKRSNENLEQFAYVASHDLQEPLRIMSSFSQLLEKRYKGRLDQDADDFIGYIVDAAGRMQRLITDLLSYSRIGRKDGFMTEVDCNEVLRRVIAGMSMIIESDGGKVDFDLLPVVKGHESSFAQLFQNLIGNALKFHGKEPPRIHVSAKDDEREWIFSVKDNGIGIEPQYRERIFLIFQRLHSKEDYPGTGIGLAICKKIVDNYGGRIWVESQPLKGSSFYFTIPKKGEGNG